LNIFTQADIKFACGILNYVNLIENNLGHKTAPLGRGAKLVAGAGFEPAAFRL